MNRLLTGLFLSSLTLLGSAGGFALSASTSSCTPQSVTAIEAGAIPIIDETCQLLDSDGGLNPVVDLVCKTVDGKTTQVRMSRTAYGAIRVAAPHDGGGGF